MEDKLFEGDSLHILLECYSKCLRGHSPMRINVPVDLILQVMRLGCRQATLTGALAVNHVKNKFKSVRDKINYIFTNINIQNRRDLSERQSRQSMTQLADQKTLLPIDP